jgi:hypothetical protein
MFRMWSRFVVTGIVAACADERAAEDHPPHADQAADYAVYAAAIDSLIIRPNELRILTLLSPTVGDGPEGMASVEAMRDDADIPSDVRTDFMEKNRTRVPVNGERFRLRVPVTVVSRDSLLAAADSSGRQEADAPDDVTGRRDYVHLSRVGFSADSTRALVYLGHSCGMLCGAGWKVQLRRNADREWLIVAADLVWIS